MGFSGWVPNEFQDINFTAGGQSWRAQILWGAPIAHDDHVHVGIRRNLS